MSTWNWKLECLSACLQRSLNTSGLLKVLRTCTPISEWETVVCVATPVHDSVWINSWSVKAKKIKCEYQSTSMSDLENTRVQVYTVNFVNQTIHRHTEYTSIMWVSRYCLDIFLNHHLWLEGQYNLCMDQQEVTLEAKRGNYIFIKTWKRNVQSNHMDMVILSQPKVPVSLFNA